MYNNLHDFDEEFEDAWMDFLLKNRDFMTFEDIAFALSWNDDDSIYMPVIMFVYI